MSMLSDVLLLSAHESPTLIEDSDGGILSNYLKDLKIQIKSYQSLGQSQRWTCMITENASLLHISDEQAQCIERLIELFHERESALRLMVHMILHDDSPMCKQRVACITQIQTNVYA